MKLGLVPKLIIAIVVGVLTGSFLPLWFCRGMVTAAGIFSVFLKFIIPLMILAYVTMGIADLSSGAGTLLLLTVALVQFHPHRREHVLCDIVGSVPAFHVGGRAGAAAGHSG